MIRGMISRASPNSPTNQRPAGLWKRDIAKLINDHAIQGGQLLDDFPGVSLGLLRDQSIDQIDGVMEANPLALIDQVGLQGDGDVRFAGAGSTDRMMIVPLHRRG